MSDLQLTVGQAKELQDALRREGSWTNEEVKALCERKGLLTKVHLVLLNHAEIRVGLWMDFNITPFVPEGYFILPEDKQLPNRVQGKHFLDLSKVALHLSEKQRNRNRVNGNDLREELRLTPVLPANLLDSLLKEENFSLIPKGWDGKYIFFWGTIYGNEKGTEFVRSLSFRHGKATSSLTCIEVPWEDYDPAAIWV